MLKRTVSGIMLTLLLIGMLSVLILSVPGTKAVTATVTVSSAYYVIEPGITFNITITVTDVTDLFLWVINLTWDPNIIKITTGDPDPNGLGDLKRGEYNIYEGPFLKSIRSTIFFATEIDNTNGKIRELACGYEPAGATPSGSGVLATINFTCVNVGTTTIEINGPGAQGESQLINSAGKGMSHEDRNGIVTFQWPPAIPVGGYSFPIKGYTTGMPLTLYLALVAILTSVFTMIKRKIHRRTKQYPH